MSDMSTRPSSAISGIVGQAACGIVHDLANVLQTILLRAEVTAATENVSPTCAKRLEQIVEDGKISADVIRSLLEFARREVDRLPAADLAPAIKKAVETVRTASGVPLNISVDLPPSPLLVRADPAQVADLIHIIVREMRRDATEATSFSIKHGRAAEAGPDATSSLWMEDAEWATVIFTREGPGAPVDLEEGALPNLAGRQIGDAQLDILRAKGIVRQHRGQIHGKESVDDAKKLLTIYFFWPAG